ncbi:MAG: AEC family transporter [Rhodospirillaceae bacterium]
MSVLIDIIVPVFGVVFLGFFAARKGWMSEAGVDGLAGFVFNFAIPAMLFRAMATRALPETVPWAFLIAYFGGVYVAWAVGMTISRRLFRRDWPAAAMAGMTAGFANTVMLGIPLVHLAFGDAALLPMFLIISFHSWQLYLVVTVIVEAARGKRGNAARLALDVVRGLVTNPIIMGMLAGILWNVLALPLPTPADRLFSLLGDAGIPCSLFCLGASLARYKLLGALPEAAAGAVLKLVLHPVAVYVLGRYGFGLEPLWLSVAVIVAATPVGINVYLFGVRYDTGTAASATAILVSTLASVATLAVLMALLGVR